MNKILLSITVLLFAASTFAANIPFEVSERSGVARTNDTIIYGIPFAESENITSTSSLGITGHDAVFKIISRYGNVSDTTRPIRSLLVGFQDSFSATQVKAYTLDTTGGSGSVSGASLATDEVGYIEISTGVAIYRISKTKGNIFDFISIGGTTVLTSPADDGYFVELGGTLYSSGNSTPTVVIEENNPIYCVIKVSGQFEDSSHNPATPAVTHAEQPDSPLRYTFRYYAYKNKPYVRLFASIKNENKAWGYNSVNIIHNAYIDQAFLKMTLTEVAGNKTVEFDSYSDTYETGDYSVRQYENSIATATAHDWQYKINGGADIAGKYIGGASLKDSSKGLFIADRWFWENHPNQLSVSNNAIYANVFPDIGTTTRLLGGSYKTHEFIIYPHSGDTSFDDEIAFLRDRPVIRCLNDRYYVTNFTYGMLPGDPTLANDVTYPAGESHQAALDRYAKDAKAKFDSSFYEGMASGGGPNSIQDLIAKKSIHDTFLADPPDFFSWYGWLFWGGTPRAENYGFSNQHYDWAFMAQLDFLQYGNLESINLAEAMLNHKVDMLIMHDPDASVATMDYEYHGGQRYEADALFTVSEDYYNSTGTNSGPRGMSHFWTKDIALAYLLSGDKKYYDALAESWEHVDRVKSTTSTINRETRHQARGIDALCNAYIVTGDTSYLSTAYGMFTSNVITREGGDCSNWDLPSTCANDGSSGWLGNRPGNQVDTGYDTYHVEPLVKLYLQLIRAGMSEQATVVSNFILRWAGWVSGTVFANFQMGQYSSGVSEYRPYSISKAVDGPTGAPVPYVSTELWDMQYSAMYADIFWLVYNLTGNTVYRSLARNVWKDYQFYETVLLPTGPEETSTLPKNATGFADNTSSGDWKIAKIIHKPAYYLANELYINRVRSIVKFGGKPIASVTTAP